MKFTVQPYTLEFLKPAVTSRGALQEHRIYVISAEQNGVSGRGECAPLPGLSPEYAADLLPQIEAVLAELNEYREKPSDYSVDLWLRHIHTHPVITAMPSLRFALETAVLDQANGGRGIICPGDFTQGQLSVPVNGLVWMSDADSMYAEAMKKISEGFTCIKFKVGALDFAEECRLIERIRKQFSAFRIELRADANGAWNREEALEALKDLSRFEMHSIEQPVKAGQWELMEEVCRKSKIPVALDEELIGVSVSDRSRLLEHIRPPYLILKPGLLGSLQAADEWISEANARGIGWWATSALESNIGLNAIAQWVARYRPSLAQGLGTGKLFRNNFETRLKLEQGAMSYLP